MAEIQFGVGANLKGTVLMITIGTGIGSGLFYNTQLIPNTELGRLIGPDNQRIELYASNRTRKDNNLSWSKWGKQFNYLLEQAATIYAPDHIILGGGVSKKFDQFKDSIRIDTPIHIASFLNNAGLVGAALAAEAAANS